MVRILLAGVSRLTQVVAFKESIRGAPTAFPQANNSISIMSKAFNYSSMHNLCQALNLNLQ